MADDIITIKNDIRIKIEARDPAATMRSSLVEQLFFLAIPVWLIK